MTFEEAMKLNFDLYKAGFPVVLKDKNGTVIRGEAELKNLGPEECRIISDIDSEKWNASESYWQEILKGAWQGMLKNKK